MLEIDEVMARIAAERPLFHSEADFQHALAWELHRQMPDASVRLELPQALPNKPIHLDLWVEQTNQAYAIELKYPTRKFEAMVANERFALKNHSAQDSLRYDFVKDIGRVEQIVAASGDINVTGYAILLTNESAFWRGGRPDANDAQFQLREGWTLNGRMAWAEKAGAGTIKGRETPLVLQGTYDLHWRDYSQPIPGRDERFRYLAVKVQAGSISPAIL